jgi:quercetin dioxygenase-like cupin family protein
MTEPFHTVRRIVTGEDAEGKGYFARVEVIEPSAPSEIPIDSYRVWGGDEIPIQLPTDGLLPPVAQAQGTAVEQAPATIRDLHPEGPNRGFRMGLYVFGPHTGSSESIGLHWHDTVDCLFVISGEMTIHLERSEMKLHPGDCLVLNGTTHCFDNHSDEQAVIGLVSFGAERHGGGADPRQALRWSPERGYHYDADPA